MPGVGFVGFSRRSRSRLFSFLYIVYDFAAFTLI